MKATELIEELERQVHEFGDGEVKTPDQLEATWKNPVDRVERDPESNSYLLVNDN